MKLNENQKVTLTLKQLKQLVKESRPPKEKPAKLHAYIRVIAEGKPHWFVDTAYTEDYDTGVIKHCDYGEQYFDTGYWDICFPDGEQTRGTAFPNIPALKQAIEDASNLAGDDFGARNYKLEVWIYDGYDFKLVKLNASGKFTVIGNYENDMHAELDEDEEDW